MKSKGFKTNSQLCQQNIESVEQQLVALPSGRKQQQTFKDYLKRKSLSPVKQSKL